MARVTPFSDYMLGIPRGDVPNTSHVNKFGRNEDVAIGVEEEIWDGSVAYSFPATALITSMSQTADQEALRGATMEIQGLDINYDFVHLHEQLDATLTTNVVTLSTPLLRVFRMKTHSAVVNDSPIRVHNAGETVDYAIIGIGNGQTLMAIYTVPRNFSAFMTSHYATVNPGTNLNPTSNPIRLWARRNVEGHAPQLKHVNGLVSGHMQHQFAPYKKFDEKTDIYITAQPVGKAADVSAGFDLILVEN
jgi:hypothetical protein